MICAQLAAGNSVGGKAMWQSPHSFDQVALAMSGGTPLVQPHSTANARRDGKAAPSSVTRPASTGFAA